MTSIFLEPKQESENTRIHTFEYPVIIANLVTSPIDLAEVQGCLTRSQGRDTLQDLGRECVESTNVRTHVNCCAPYARVRAR